MIPCGQPVSRVAQLSTSNPRSKHQIDIKTQQTLLQATQTETPTENTYRKLGKSGREHARQQAPTPPNLTLLVQHSPSTGVLRFLHPPPLPHPRKIKQNAPRLVRWISGTVLSSSSFSYDHAVYSRKHLPAAQQYSSMSGSTHIGLVLIPAHSCSPWPPSQVSSGTTHQRPQPPPTQATLNNSQPVHSHITPI